MRPARNLVSALILVGACRPQAEPQRVSADTPSVQVQVPIEVRQVVRLTGTPDLSRAPCLNPDSLAPNHRTLAFAYAAVDTEETGDVAGEVFYLVLNDSTPAVLRREASGEWGMPHAVDSAAIDLRNQTLWIRVDSVYTLRGDFGCDSLWAEATIYGQRTSIVMHRADPYLAEAPN